MEIWLQGCHFDLIVSALGGLIHSFICTGIENLIWESITYEKNAKKMNNPWSPLWEYLKENIQFDQSFPYLFHST